MSSSCRSAVAAFGRILRSKSHVAQKATSFSTTHNKSSAYRFAMVLGSVETMIPLHSAIASARLRSNLAVGPTCWSMLSQGFATPL